jgi:hypothetical protein
MTILDSTVVSGDDESFDGPLINDDKATKSDQSLADEPANSAKPEDVDSKEPDAKEKKASALKRFLSNKLSF